MPLLPKPSKDQAYHHRFQVLVAAIFLMCAAAVGLWMWLGPHPDDPLQSGMMLFLVEMPLFVILALVGMNALVRLGMGKKRSG